MTNSMAEQDKTVADLIDSIRRSFPVVRYTGDVTQFDAKLDDPDFYDIKLDSDVPDFWDEKELRDSFKDRCWADVSRELLFPSPRRLCTTYGPGLCRFSSCLAYVFVRRHG